MTSTPPLWEKKSSSCHLGETGISCEKKMAPPKNLWGGKGEAILHDRGH